MNPTFTKLWPHCSFGQAVKGCPQVADAKKLPCIVVNRNASMFTLHQSHLPEVNADFKYYVKANEFICRAGKGSDHSGLVADPFGPALVRDDGLEPAPPATPSAIGLEKRMQQRESNLPSGVVNESLADFAFLEEFGSRGQAALKLSADQELLAYLVNSEDLAGRLLHGFGSLHALAASHPNELREYCTEPELAKLCIAFELGRRLCRTPFNRGEAFHGSRQVYEHFHSYIREERQECFIALYLDARHRLLAQEEISRGSLTASLVHPREVLRPAIRLSAAALLCVHNHPSGDCLYSKEDLEVTKRLKAGSELIGIDLLDHIIIGDHGYFSFADAQIGPFEL